MLKTKQKLSTLFLFSMLAVFNFANLVHAQSGMSIPETGLPDPSGGIKDVLTAFLNWALGIIGLLAIISFIIAGAQYFFAIGNEKDMQTAKRNMTYSIIGIVVALSGYIAIQAIDAALRGTSSF